VAELVEDVSSRGLCFAPAEDGGERAYTVLHGKLAAYAMAIADSWSPWE